MALDIRYESLKRQNYQHRDDLLGYSYYIDRTEHHLKEAHSLHDAHVLAKEDCRKEQLLLEVPLSYIDREEFTDMANIFLKIARDGQIYYGLP
ncbi:MAG: hypothetical protein B0D92_06980 [Spirochaeta sp. LUC14_002_19_P3]|nr:MAG: hypothetical protein B0D92_06980 [Spirochaeta sp. LUC14_002_19_P3]